MRALILTFFISLFSINAYAATMGELSIFIIKDGKPLANAKIKIDGTIELTTDKDGSAVKELPIGKHQAIIDAKEEGNSVAVAKHNFIIAPDQNTEVILTLSEKGKLENVEVEATQDAAKYADSNGTLKVDKRAKAELKGFVLSSEDKKPIAGARLFVKGSLAQTSTDTKGAFTLEIYEGNNTLSVIHDKFSAKTLKIEAVAKQKIAQNIELSPAGMELEEFVVLKPTVEGSIASSIAEVRNSDTVGDVLGSEQFSKSGDSSAAAALKRVSGITIVGGKYVFIRGLGDRYSTIMLNDMYVPSPEPTKRVVPLNIFPTAVISSMKIQKTYSADVPGSFGGGAVMIRSKDIPEEGGFFKGDVTLLTNSDTGSTVKANGDNGKGLPDSVIKASDNFANISNTAAMTKAVVNNRTFGLSDRVLAPGIKVSLAGGDSFKTKSGWLYGYTASLLYSHEEDADSINFTKYVFDNTTQNYLLDSTTQRNVATFTTKLGGLLSFGLDTKKGTKAKYTMLLIHEANDATTSGHTDYEGSTNDKDLTYLEYTEKNIFMNQLNGEHEFRFSDSRDGYFDNLIMTMDAEFGLASRIEPGTFEYSYEYLTATPFLSQNSWYLYSYLLDSVLNYRADFKLPFRFNHKDNYTQFGAFGYNKSRSLDNRRFRIQHFLGDTGALPQQSIDTILSDTYVDSGDVQFTTNYRTDDAYTAKQDVLAFYLKQYLSLTRDLDMIAGARFENSNQQLFDVATGIPYDPLKTSNLLPAVGLTYRINDKMQLRGGYSVTLSRPDFREFSPNRFKDPITENIVFGFPGLLSTTITNYDMKYEWYITPEEIFSFALFSKGFENPIETINVIDVQSADNTQLVSYRNAKSATSYGLEVDLRKRFDFINKKLHNYVLATNVSLINSSIILNVDPNDIFLSNLTTTERAMQGQSPYVINIQMGYDNPETGNSALLMFNEIGPRISAIGTYQNEDEYEQPFRRLDFTAGYKITTKKDMTYRIKFKMSNILDSDVTITKGSLVTKQFKPGQSYSLSVGLSY